MTAVEKYNARAERVGSLVCVGLDSDIKKLPHVVSGVEFPQAEFNTRILREVGPHVAAVKPNLAFYEARGDQGWRELKMTMDWVHENLPDVLTIADAKRGDIGNTNEGYASAIFDWLGFDAVTLHPYLGKEALQPFLDRADKGCIILCRTSNPGAREFQDLILPGTREYPDGVLGKHTLWQLVAEQVSRDWNENGNCLLVMGATYPDEIAIAREITGDMTFLVPGVGAQGGDVKAAVQNGLNSEGKGLIINASRSIIFASSGEGFAETAAFEARRLQGLIEEARPTDSDGWLKGRRRS